MIVGKKTIKINKKKYSVYTFSTLYKVYILSRFVVLARSFRFHGGFDFIPSWVDFFRSLFCTKAERVEVGGSISRDLFRFLSSLFAEQKSGGGLSFGGGGGEVGVMGEGL